MTFRNDIQVLRAVAVLLVIFYHLEIPGFYNGFLGVDVFFVISGYLMANIYNLQIFKMFYIQRAKRLIPTYWAVLMLVLVVGFTLLTPSDYMQ